jgi:hypothetical protein
MRLAVVVVEEEGEVVRTVAAGCCPIVDDDVGRTTKAETDVFVMNIIRTIEQMEKN